MTATMLIAAVAGSALAFCPPTECNEGPPQAVIVGAAFTPAEALVAAEPEAVRPRIDVVFVLDTTGSMSGLIEGAKAKIWSVANQIASADPKPLVRIGLVAYRDVGDEYVTKLTPLSDDLDTVYADLMKLSANGGGDTPESVNQGLNEAVAKIAWEEGASRDNYLKLIYLVGDCPPHMDYAQDVKYEASCKLAAERGITINTIQCGNHSETTPIWQEIARKAEGEFFQIDQSGGMTAIATPFDEEMARLGRDLDGTLVSYGSAQAQAAMAYKVESGRKIDAAAPAEALAERAACKADGGATLWGRQELIQDCAEGKVKLADLKDEELPEPMRAMNAAERESYVKEQSRARSECQAKIADVNGKRQAFIKEKLAEAGGDSFDAKVMQALRVQAAKCGIRYAAAK
ncbi:MAG: vWA domain-containing protein [Phycisphaerales bacterium]